MGQFTLAMEQICEFSDAGNC